MSMDEVAERAGVSKATISPAPIQWLRISSRQLTPG
jgi:hypothetical protein